MTLLRTRSRQHYDPAVGVADLMGPFAKLFEEKQSRDLNELLKPLAKVKAM